MIVGKGSKSNLHRWLVSYADFITLLFAVFVVMYAVTNVSLEKYKALLHVLDIPFKEVNKLDPRDIEKKIMNDIALNEHAKHIASKINSQDQLEEVIDEILDNLRGKFEIKIGNKDNEDPGGINVDNSNEALGFSQVIGTTLETVEERRSEDWLEIEMRSIFPSASAYPRDAAMPLLELIADILKKHNGPISVAGYTDNIPIKTEGFPSNWELSAARSAAVVRVLEEYGVNSARLTAVGYGALHPVGNNETDEGRKKNRRVSLIIALNDELSEELTDRLRPYTRRHLSKTNTIEDDQIAVNLKTLRLQPGDNRMPADFLPEKQKNQEPAAQKEPAFRDTTAGQPPLATGVRQ